MNQLILEIDQEHCIIDIVEIYINKDVLLFVSSYLSYTCYLPWYVGGHGIHVADQISISSFYISFIVRCSSFRYLHNTLL